jgi:hypothetical protein
LHCQFVEIGIEKRKHAFRRTCGRHGDDGGGDGECERIALLDVCGSVYMQRG